MIEAGDNLNLGWARLMIEELYRLGLRHLCLAPGSRSAPLVQAAAAHNGLTKHLHFDERGLGFFALGLAKGLDAPVAILTTSGTAVANLYPAVIEARLTQVPLLILSADRPLELLECGANQAITQSRIFADYPVFQQALPAPDLAISPRFLLGSLDHAWQQLSVNPGPVHINCPYPEPLYAGQGTPLPAGWPHELAQWRVDGAPLTRYVAAESQVLPDPEWPPFAHQRGIVVAGQITTPDEARAVELLARQLGWPLLADVQSQLRGSPHALRHYDLALHNPAFTAELARAQVLLQVGGRLLSKRLSHFIATHAWQARWLLAPHGERLAPDYALTRRLVAPVAQWCRLHSPTQAQPPWHKLPELAAPIAELLTEALQAWSEPAICHWLCDAVPGQLLLGNSLPARLMDMLGTQRPAVLPSRLFSNRGASGIDGLIATAAGLASAAPTQPTTLLLGDTSALHDLNSLALLRRLTTPFVLLLINNDGGGIFSLLPGAAQSGLLDEYFRLPHGLDFAHAAAQFGLSYAAPRSLDELTQHYQQALQGGVTLLECQVPAGEAAELLAKLAQACRALHE